MGRDTVGEFAALLADLKRRSGLSYEALAHRCENVSASTVHRYCQGQTLPSGYAVVEQLAGACGASRNERRELQRRWVAADYDRGRGTESPPAGPARSDPEPEPAEGRTIPRQLPAAARHFVARTSQLEALSALVKHQTTMIDSQLEAGGAVVISSIDGTAGIGKTALAVHWAHGVADRFVDGQLFVNLRGFDPSGDPLSPDEVLRRFLDALGVPPRRIPVDPDSRANLYRSLLSDRRVLVVLDNARDAEQVRPLLPGSPGCLALVTSRNDLAGLVAVQDAHPLTLDLLTPAEARDMLAERLGADRVDAEPEAVEEIITWCARLPLALAIVAARAATHPRFPLSALAVELRSGLSGLDALAGGDDAASDVRAVFSWSYHTLSPAAARLFRLLGLHPGPELRIPAAASVAGLSIGRTRPLLTELARAHLIAEQTPGGYAMHDLLSAYAQERTRELDSDTERHSALHRMLDHYLHTAQAAAQHLDPHRKPVALAPPQPGVTVVAPPDLDTALAILSSDYLPLFGCIAVAVDHGFDAHAWQLAWTLTTFLDRQGRWQDRVAAHTAALTSARRLGDREGQARMHQGLANTYARLGRLDASRIQLRFALELLGQLDDHAGQANLHLILAFVCQRQGDSDEALSHAQASVDLYRTASDAAGYARALNEVGWQNALRGNYTPALEHCERALALLQDLNDRYGQAGTWDSLGYIHHHTGRHHNAIECYEHALRLLRDIGDVSHQVEVLVRLGDTHHDVGDVESARTSWTLARALGEDADHPDAKQADARLRQLPPASESAWPVAV